MMPGMMPPGMGGMGMGGMGMGYPGMMPGMNPGMGVPGMMPGVGGGYPGMMPAPDLSMYEEVLSRVATGLVAVRVRTRALLELLEEKGVLLSDEFDEKADMVWQRD